MKSIIPSLLFLILIALIVVGVLIYKDWQARLDSGSASLTSSLDKKVEVSDLWIGESDAPVTVVEYFSYLCGYCELFHEETLPKIKEKYIDTGKVKFVYRIFPPFELGTAVLCANEQGNFLDYHNYLFDHLADIKGVEDIKNFAENVGLNRNEFDQCFESAKYLERAQEWQAQGDSDFEAVNIPPEQRGTPAFFVDGELLLGAQPFENFEEVIERKLNE